MTEDEKFMALALNEARLALNEGEMPVGAVVTENGQIVSRAHNTRGIDLDPTAHAEITALRRAALVRGGWRLDGMTLYVTLEPCPMCAGAVVQSRVARLVYGADDPNAGCAGSVYRITEDPAFSHFAPACGGVMKDECKALLDAFFRARRQSFDNKEEKPMRPLDDLALYVNTPSCSRERDDVLRMADLLCRDFERIGMRITRNESTEYGPTIECRWGSGPKKLMLLGHYDTVFPRDEAVPFSADGDTLNGSGVSDMKGGLVVMRHALIDSLPHVDPEKFSVVCVLTPDEEIGAPSSAEHIVRIAKECFAALSFEAARPGGALVIQRKGVSSFELRSRGIRGHAGSMYLKSASAIQELCRKIDLIYGIRDDAREISVNIGGIGGSGDAINIVADEAWAKGEYRMYDPDYEPEIRGRIAEICARDLIPGASTEAVFRGKHPAVKATEESLLLLQKAQEVGKGLGAELVHQKTGGAGDIGYVAMAGVPALDGLGLEGGNHHAPTEYALADKFPFAIGLASGLIKKLLAE